MRRVLIRSVIVATLTFALSACWLFGPRPVESGTIDGLGFRVVSGTIFQDEDDGPLYAAEEGGLIVLDDAPAALGMTDPNNLRLDWSFTLADGGEIEARAYGASSSSFAGALGFRLVRSGSAIGYTYDLTTEADLTGSADLGTSGAGDTFAIVTEFYAVDPPGYGSGSSGMTVWSLGDTSPAFNTDILGCPAAVQTGTLADQEVGFRLTNARLESITAVDTIVGPCE